MSALHRLRRGLGFDPQRWIDLRANGFGAAVMVVLATAGGMSLARFGGTSLGAPRSFARLAVVPIWGWLAMSATVWVVGVARGWATRDRDGATNVLTAVGVAHLPLLGLAGWALFVGGVLDITGPGELLRVATLYGWFPALLVAGLAWIGPTTMTDAAVAVLAPYAVWVVLVGSLLTDRLAHLF